MKIKEIMNIAVREGIASDPRGRDEISRILDEKKKEYDGLEGVKKELYDSHLLESPYADSRIIWGDPDYDASEAWVSIDVDTSELLLVKKITEETSRKPVVISHHPEGRAYSNFYEVMDMQSDILQGFGVAASIADTVTRSRKNEVERKVAPSNHFKVQDAARILQIPVMSIHTPADNHVAGYLASHIEERSPRRLKNLIDLLLEVPEYRHSAMNGQPPRILHGSPENKCGKVFVDMTGGTENDPSLLGNLAASGVSTVVGMHMSDRHYKKAQEVNINVVIAGHISSDNVGLNLLLDKVTSAAGPLEIIEFGGFFRVRRDD